MGKMIDAEPILEMFRLGVKAANEQLDGLEDGPAREVIKTTRDIFQNGLDLVEAECVRRNMIDEIDKWTAPKNGEWVYTEAKGGMYYWYCSACEHAYHKSDPRNKLYCYHCGAKMNLNERYK